MGGNAFFLQHVKEKIRDYIIYFSFILNGAFFEAVQCCSVVFIANYYIIVVISCIYFFSFALIKLGAFLEFHNLTSYYLFIR